MKVFVVGNAHLIKDSNGDVFASSVYNYEFLKRYLSVFDEVRFIGKFKYQDNFDKCKYNKVSGPNIEFIELPWYQGYKQMIKVLPKLIGVYRKSVKDVDCYIFRIAQIESFFVYLFSRLKKRKPFAVEVVNDPATFYDMKSIVRKFSIYMVKHMCKTANGASYVTQFQLQNNYPCTAKIKGESKKYFESYYSSVEIDANYITKTPINYTSDLSFKIVHVANAINSDVKGHYTLIKAIQKVVNSGKKVEVICVGDGIKVTEYKNFIASLNLDEAIHFIGRVSRKEDLINLLSTCHLMVLPTRMEGLPRTIIEAFSVGLPCLSTPIAGIPELLDSEYLFDPDDVDGFANKIIELIDNPKELTIMSTDNISKAKNYTNEILQSRRRDFYQKLRDLL